MSVVETIRDASIVGTARDVYAVARRAQVSMLAAGLAFFGVTSLIPFALLVVVLVVAVGDESLVERALETTATVFGEELARRIGDAVFAQGARVSSSFIGAVVFLWSGLRLFGSTDRAFAAVYGVRAERSVRESVRNAVIVMVTTLLSLLLLGGFGVAFGLEVGTLSPVAPLLLFAVLVGLYVPMFYVFPPTEVSLPEVLPGAGLAAGGWALASVCLGAYGRVTGGGSYGTAGLLLLALSWFYLGALAVLLGAALNAVRCGHVDPDDEWAPPGSR